MTALPFPIYSLDFEASGGGPDSYPIEVGLAVWRGVDQPIVTWSALIAPIDCWSHWDWNAQAIHGIERVELAAGSPPAVVAAWLNELAGGEILYSDAPAFEALWAKKLFQVAAIEPAFTIGDIADIADLLDTAQAGRRRTWLVQAPKRHRSADDAERELRGFARALKVRNVTIERRHFL